MEKESLIFIVGVIGNIMSGFVYLSPMKTFWRIVKNKSTEDFESIPYVCTLLNAYFWIYYGLIRPNSLLVATINCFGIVAETVYVTLFLIFAPPRMRARTAMLVAVLDVGFPVAALLLTHFMLDGCMRINVAGLLCVFFSMISYGSPLAALKTVLRSKSVEYMPFLLSLILFINGGIWTLYAVLAKDYFVGVPNGSGFFLGTIQLVLYAMYWKPKKLEKMSDNLEEEPWQQQHEPLIIPASSPISLPGRSAVN